MQGSNGPTYVIMNGDLACAYFVSSILTLCDLTKGGVHTTVDETVLDIEASDWRKISEVKPGAIIVWSAKLSTDGLKHRHIGFALANNMAISNISEKRVPGIHHITYGEEGTSTYQNSTYRAIESIYFHPDLLTK